MFKILPQPVTAGKDVELAQGASQGQDGAMMTVPIQAAAADNPERPSNDVVDAATGVPEWASPRKEGTTVAVAPGDQGQGEGERRSPVKHSRAAMKLAHMEDGPPASVAAAGTGNPGVVFHSPRKAPNVLPTFKERFAAFSAMTTAHGLALAMDNRYPRLCRFVTWLIITLAGIGVFAWTCAQQYSDVGQYPVNLEGNTTLASSMPLPQVSVCTFANPGDPNAVGDADVAAAERAINTFILDCYINRLQGSNFSCVGPEYWQVVNSSWNTYSYSTCYTLFGIGTAPPPASAAFGSSGTKNSLEIVLDLGNGDANRLLQAWDFADGVQIAIQPSSQFALPLTGFTAAPGMNTVAAIAKRTATRQNSPYNPETNGCSNDPRYTMEICNQLCSSFQTFKELAAQAASLNETEIQNQFLSMVTNDTAAGYVCPSQCQPACFQEDYSFSTSLRSMTAPFMSYYCNSVDDGLAMGLCLENSTSPGECALGEDGYCLPNAAQFASRVVSLTFYPSTLSVANSNESPKYQAWGIISGIGGNLGLLLGFSLLTLLEWAEFFFCGTCLYPAYVRCLRTKPWDPDL